MLEKINEPKYPKSIPLYLTSPLIRCGPVLTLSPDNPLVQMNCSYLIIHLNQLLFREQQYKTTMVVRLHPGHSRRLSTCLDKVGPINQSIQRFEHYAAALTRSNI